MPLFSRRPEARFDIRADDKTRAAFSSATKSLKGFESSVRMTAGSVAGLLGVGGGIAGFAGLARSAAVMATEIDNTSRKLGVSAEFLQAWQFAAEQVGVTSEAASTGLQRFSRRVAEAASGTGVLLGILEDNEIALRDSEGRLRTTNQVLRDFADLIAETPEAAEQLRIAVSGFDTEGAGLVSILRDGAAGVDAFISKAQSAGQVMSDEVVAKLAEANQNLENLQRRITIAAGDIAGIGLTQGFSAGGLRALSKIPGLGALDELREMGQPQRLGPINIPNRRSEVPGFADREFNARLIDVLDRIEQNTAEQTATYAD